MPAGGGPALSPRDGIDNLSIVDRPDRETVLG
jgi:hypothetical protein